MAMSGLPAWEVVCGDSLDSLRKMRDGVIHCCVTSPPYFGLRDYGSPHRVWGGDAAHDHVWGDALPALPAHHPGQVEQSKWKTADAAGKGQTAGSGRYCACGAWLGAFGLEPTPDLYVAHAVEIFREVKRVLRSDGTFWLNIGDSYASAGGAASGGYDGGILASKGREDEAGTRRRARFAGVGGLKPKDLIGIPWMLAFALRADGWYLRSDIVWAKGNPMPESVEDRPTRAHEYIFLLTKSAKYYYDYVGVQEDAVGGAKGSTFTNGKTAVNGGERLGQGPRDYDSPKRNRRSVWNINAQPFKGAHFAVFPRDLVEPCVKAGTSERGVCPVCAAPWERVVERTAMIVEPSARREEAHAAGAGSGRTVISGTMTAPATTTTTGWRSTCGHSGEPVPALVLDPFNGSGTTGLVSTQLGRRYLGFDVNEAYCAMARERISGGVK